MQNLKVENPEDVDLLLYVALAEEFRGIRQILETDLGFQLSLKEHPTLALTLYRGVITLPDSEYKILVVPAGAMGNTRAAGVVGSLISTVKCRDLVVLGIAGTISTDLQPGDVFVPGSIVEYLANSAVTDSADKTNYEFQTSGNQYQTSPRLLTRFQFNIHEADKVYGDWRTSSNSRFHDLKTPELTQALSEHHITLRDEINLIAVSDTKLASGPAVGKSEIFAQWLNARDRKLAAIEMESAGVYDLPSIGIAPPRTVAIRGISDFADKRKKALEDVAHRGFRALAIQNATSLFCTALRAGVFAPEEPPPIQIDQGEDGNEVKKKYLKIKTYSDQWFGEIRSTLPTGFSLPREVELSSIKSNHANFGGGYILGDSGTGKSALLKKLAEWHSAQGLDVVWLKADQAGHLLGQVPDISEVLQVFAIKNPLLVVDSLENCYQNQDLDRIGHLLQVLVASDQHKWKIAISCQPSSWERVMARLYPYLKDHACLAKPTSVGMFSDSDFQLLCENSSTIANLSSNDKLRRFLKWPKMVDLLLRSTGGDAALNVAETDIIDWWWNEEVRSGRPFAGEEKFARHLACYLADNLTTEASPDAVSCQPESINALAKRQVLTINRDGRIRFDHDILADWSRVMHLRSLGHDLVSFIFEHCENPPWLRAIQLLSAHSLESHGLSDDWKHVADACKSQIDDNNTSSTRAFLILDSWIEGIISSSRSLSILRSDSAFFWKDSAFYLSRLLTRLQTSATSPDMEILKHVADAPGDVLNGISLAFRKPVASKWKPILIFLVENSDAGTDLLPASIASAGKAWANYIAPLGQDWPEFYDLLILNGEKEIRREAKGEYRGSSQGENWRASIYSAALLAGTQNPERVSKFALKASGRAPWDSDEMPENFEPEWRGEWPRATGYFSSNRHYVTPITSWTEGPNRKTSLAFYHSWFATYSSLPLFKEAPDRAAEVTMAMLLSWPKEHPPRESVNRDNYGFVFDHRVHYPSFWTKGPYLFYLASHSLQAIELIIRIVNFATERYIEWWDPNDLINTEFHTSVGSIVWKGNSQVYCWNRYQMNTQASVTCALMALERWLDERVKQGHSVASEFEFIFKHGTSVALAGVLIAIAKRHPKECLQLIQPLLRPLEIYDYDFAAVNEYKEMNYFDLEDSVTAELRVQWAKLAGRSTWLRDACTHWIITLEECEAIFTDLAEYFIELSKSEGLSDEQKHELRRHGVMFNPSLWSKEVDQAGRIFAYNRSLDEFNDPDAQEALEVQRSLIQYRQFIRSVFSDKLSLTNENYDKVWLLLQDRDTFKIAERSYNEGGFSGGLLDPRHCRVGLIAVLLARGEGWLAEHPDRFDPLQEELIQLTSNFNQSRTLSNLEIADDSESYLARSAVHCWKKDVSDYEWRTIIASLLTARRYDVPRQLFDEAIRVRQELGSAFDELQSFVVGYAPIRLLSQHWEYSRPTEEELEHFQKESASLIERFAKGDCPSWTYDWVPDCNDLEEEGAEQPPDEFPFLPPHVSRPPREVHRRLPRTDECLLLACFAQFPALLHAFDAQEREHWLRLTHSLLKAFHSGLPVETTGSNTKWAYQISQSDSDLYDHVAKRCFEATTDEAEALWKDIISLPPAGHQEICAFLNSLILQALNSDPPEARVLAKHWMPILKRVETDSRWQDHDIEGVEDTWKVLLFYGSHFTGVADSSFSFFVDMMKPYYKRHIQQMYQRVYTHNEILGFLCGAASGQTFVEIFEWFHPIWRDATQYYWSDVPNYTQFRLLLRIARDEHYEDIKRSKGALLGFNTLLSNLAILGDALAIQIQQQVGTEAEQK